MITIAPLYYCKYSSSSIIIFNLDFILKYIVYSRDLGVIMIELIVLAIF